MPELNKNCPHLNPSCTNRFRRPNCWQCTKNPDFDKLPKCEKCGNPVMSDGIKLCEACTRNLSTYTNVHRCSPKFGILELEVIEQPELKKARDFKVPPEFIAAVEEYAKKKKEAENESNSETV